MKFIKPRLISENSDFQIPNIIWKLNKIFNDNGHKLYVVGGAVRDFKTGDKPKDFDLCTDAMPEKVIEMLKEGI
jgi:tRNA nucleotidyltransferase (CCA-adding enzyme)